MSKRDTKDLRKCLQPFPAAKRKLAFALRAFVWDLYPTANELIYDNYNAVAFGWSTSERVSEVFTSIAVGRSSGNVHFGFYWGSKFADPRKMLLGQGNQYRYILVESMEEFPASYMKTLMKKAYQYSLSKMKDPASAPAGTTVLKSISAVKRPKAKTKKKRIPARARKRM